MKNPFIFNWRIENFSNCLQKLGAFIESPTFNIGSTNDTKCCLRLYPGGRLSELHISCHLHLINGLGQLSSGSRVKLSMISSCPELTDHIVQEYVKTEQIFKIYVSEKRSEIYKVRSYLLPDDTLTVECKIKEPDCDSPFSFKCYGKTVVSAKCHTFEFYVKSDMFIGTKGWNSLLKYSTIVLNQIQPGESSEEFQVTFRSDCPLNGISTNIVEIEKMTENKIDIFLSLKLSLCNIGSVFLARGERCFQVGVANSTLQIPFILNEEQLRCLGNNSISIFCDFKISDGSSISSFDMDSLPKQNINGGNTVISGILDKVYTHKKYSDIILQVGSVQYPANKCILAAASPVFEAMFESDMKETKTNVVNIKDIDSTTIDKMLQFLYFGQVENFEFNMAAKLYSAADKYQIFDLKQECSNYFFKKLSVETICEVLELAYLHSDQEMEAGARRFIFSNRRKVCQSPNWKNFMEKHVKLAADVMLHMCIRV